MVALAGDAAHAGRAAGRELGVATAEAGELGQGRLAEEAVEHDAIGGDQAVLDHRQVELGLQVHAAVGDAGRVEGRPAAERELVQHAAGRAGGPVERRVDDAGLAFEGAVGVVEHEEAPHVLLALVRHVLQQLAVVHEAHPLPVQAPTAVDVDLGGDGDAHPAGAPHPGVPVVVVALGLEEGGAAVL